MEKLFSYLEGLKAAMLGEFAKLSSAQSELTTAKVDLAAAQAAVKNLQGAISDANGKLATAEASVTDLTAKLTAANEQAIKDASALKDLTEKLAASEAKADQTHKDAQDLIAGQGLAFNKTPAGQEPQSNGKTAFEIYNDLLFSGKTQEAAQFHAKNVDAILSRK